MGEQGQQLGCCKACMLDEDCPGNGWRPPCASHTSATAQPIEARQRVELENLCNIDLTHYVWGEMAAEDVSQCRGKDCNYCGRWTALLQAGDKE